MTLIHLPIRSLIHSHPFTFDFPITCPWHLQPHHGPGLGIAALPVHWVAIEGTHRQGALARQRVPSLEELRLSSDPVKQRNYLNQHVTYTQQLWTFGEILKNPRNKARTRAPHLQGKLCVEVGGRANQGLVERCTLLTTPQGSRHSSERARTMARSPKWQFLCTSLY